MMRIVGIRNLSDRGLKEIWVFYPKGKTGFAVYNVHVLPETVDIDEIARREHVPMGRGKTEPKLSAIQLAKVLTGFDEVLFKFL